MFSDILQSCYISLIGKPYHAMFSRCNECTVVQPRGSHVWYGLHIRTSSSGNHYYNKVFHDSSLTIYHPIQNVVLPHLNVSSCSNGQHVVSHLEDRKYVAIRVAHNKQDNCKVTFSSLGLGMICWYICFSHRMICDSYLWKVSLNFCMLFLSSAQRNSSQCEPFHKSYCAV